MWVFDGGATQFCPVLDENSITCSVFGKADIRPSRLVVVVVGGGGGGGGGGRHMIDFLVK